MPYDVKEVAFALAYPLAMNDNYLSGCYNAAANMNWLVWC